MPTSSSKTAASNKNKTKSAKSRPLKKKSWLNQAWLNFKNWVSDLLSRRPHRSFRRTTKHDYNHKLKLPGLFELTFEVTGIVWKYRRILIGLSLIYIFIYGTISIVQSQQVYGEFADSIKSISTDVFGGDLSTFGQVGSVFLALMINTFGSGASGTQQAATVVLATLVWLTTVWLLRHLLAGKKVKLRDGLYNAGAPIFASLVLILVGLAQLLPVAAVSLGYGAAQSTGLLGGGAPTMLFWIAAGLLIVLSAYWLTSTLFAMIIVTLPGTYPYQALKIAGDMLIGNRLKVLLRWVWMIFIMALVNSVAVIVFIAIDMGVKTLIPAISWLPIVPVAITIMLGLSIVWIASYVYMVYRKVVDSAAE